ncbi:MAG: phosphoenolpyruvate carboxykinase (ATP) [Candidatus Handelsmanbacteria bacterium]|nr:phosphoenolpyruvate carboxykinase (ATP) [Candidatus Handelsmanbacteria bacterium]
MQGGAFTVDFGDTGKWRHNLTTSMLYEEIVRRGEGTIAHLGPVVVHTGKYTGRSPGDKFLVQEPKSEKEAWWGRINRPMAPGHFGQLLERVQEYLGGREIFVQDCYAGADPQCRVALRVFTERAWHSLFARNMFIREPDPEHLARFAPDLQLIYAPGFAAVPERDHTRSEVFVVIHLERRLILIGGTSYAGELKKAVFTVLNYLYPTQGMMSMHCSANKNSRGETTLYFGLSGTGKTTLSANANYILIGDDEHGWNERGIFNFEGGCYAKVIRLNAQAEPEIHGAVHRFGAVLENVAIDTHTRFVDLDDDRFTENTRASYPLSYIPNASLEGLGSHPTNIIMLTCDAFGVLPPVAHLTPEQAMYHFISGYTAKVAGTERGVAEPTATFSPCFGAPFLVLHPTAYTRLLGDRIRRHQARCWLVNTGWNGGPYGEGKRIRIDYTRAIVAAILDRRLERVARVRHGLFGLEMPTACPGVPREVLEPRGAWRDPAAYDAKARHLVGLFNEHFAEYESLVPELRAVAPTAG